MNLDPSSILDDGVPATPPPGPILVDDGGGACHWTWGGTTPNEWRLEQFSGGAWISARLYPPFVTSATGVAVGLPTRVAGINGVDQVLATGYSNIVTLA